MRLRSAEEIFHSIELSIRNVLTRPAMYVGSIESPTSADELDIVLWTLFYLWSTSCSREGELASARNTANHFDESGAIAPLRRFDELNRSAGSDARTTFVLNYWTEVGAILQIDVKTPPKANEGILGA